MDVRTVLPSFTHDKAAWMSLRRDFLTFSTLAAALALSACSAGGGIVGSGAGRSYAANYAGAESAVQNADEARAADFAPREMRAAHDKLNASHEALLRKDSLQALWYADEAAINADIATARATRARSLAAIAAASSAALPPSSP